MLDNRDKYYKYLLGGISAGTIVALGTIAPGGSFQYLYAPQIYQDIEGEPIGIIGTSSNMIGEFSCVYITLGDFKCFPFLEAAASMSKLLKHTKVTPLLLEHLKFTKDWKRFIDPIRGTFLPIFFIVYFGQEIPQGSISSDNVKTAMAKMSPGYALWVSTVSNAIDNIDDINCVGVYMQAMITSSDVRVTYESQVAMYNRQVAMYESSSSDVRISSSDVQSSSSDVRISSSDVRVTYE